MYWWSSNYVLPLAMPLLMIAAARSQYDLRFLQARRSDSPASSVLIARTG
jgi:hypothetical protein